MATIVQMPPPRPRTARAADTQDGATILFFTGIRYMRDEETDEDGGAFEGREPPADQEAVLAMI